MRKWIAEFELEDGDTMPEHMDLEYEGAKIDFHCRTMWIPCSERLPSKEECKEWIDNNLDGIGYLYPCLVTRYSSINPDMEKNNPYVAKHYFDGEDFLNAGEEVCSEYIIAWMPLPEPYKDGEQNDRT